MQGLRTEPALSLTHTIFQDLANWALKEPSLLTDLYKSPHATQAVLRSLPPIARLYVARLLFVPSHEVHPALDEFRGALRLRQRARDRHDTAVNALKALHIFVDAAIDVDNPDAPARVSLNPRFASGLRCAVSGSVPPVFGGGYQDQPDFHELAEFSAEKLERILNYLVESSGSNTPSNDIIRALVFAGILESRHEGMSITSSGFQFLLQDTFAQLWTLLRAVVAAHFMHARVQSLDLLFQLSFACPGRQYDMRELDAVQQELMVDLHELGVVMVQGTSFRPTAVGVKLLGSASRKTSGTKAPVMAKSAGEIQIFVETNFRLYAYTSSAFQTNLLGLFTHLRYRLPGMIVGHLTRDAVRKALQNGITGDQIIGYLNTHAHPRMKRGVIPSNVSDEIRLWEAEQDRVKTEPAIMLTDFEFMQSYDRAHAYADSLGAVFWSSRAGMQMIVARRDYEKIKRFIKSNGIR